MYVGSPPLSTLPSGNSNKLTVPLSPANAGIMEDLNLQLGLRTRANLNLDLFYNPGY